MLNKYSVYLSQNKTTTSTISKILEKYLSAKLTKVRSDYLVGVEESGKYTMVFNNSRLTFNFSSKVTEPEIRKLDTIIEKVIDDCHHNNGYVIHKNFEFLNEKILRN